ncbi:hypothetical protein ACFP2T_42705 [Plantactinospora solaniradicis]|uniref:PrgI family protein n=1 Tax=Plantactinospora solaniradicis TaxID=1723736 RepID=A0ABW1KQM1_9ACTN
MRTLFGHSAPVADEPRSDLPRPDHARSGPEPNPGSLAGTRLKLVVLAGLSATAFITGLPLWQSFGILTTTLLIPVAVTAQDGRAGLRRLLLGSWDYRRRATAGDAPEPRPPSRSFGPGSGSGRPHQADLTDPTAVRRRAAQSRSLCD